MIYDSLFVFYLCRHKILILKFYSYRIFLKFKIIASRIFTFFIIYFQEWTPWCPQHHIVAHYIFSSKLLLLHSHLYPVSQVKKNWSLHFSSNRISSCFYQSAVSKACCNSSSYYLFSLFHDWPYNSQPLSDNCKILFLFNIFLVFSG